VRSFERRPRLGGLLGICRHGHEDREEIVDELTGAIERFTRSAG
jgi:hypothetical protein